jgi:integrase
MARKKTRSYGEGSAYAYKTKSGTKYRWQASFREDPFDELSALKRLSKGGYATLKEANAEMQRVLIDARAGTNPSSSRESFESYSKLWLEKQKLANSTLMGYEKIVRVHLVPRLGKLKLTQIVPSTISKLYRDLEKNGNRGRLTSGNPLSANSVNKIHIVLGSILKSAVDDGLLRINHARNNPKAIEAPTARSIRMEKKELRTWAASQMVAFLEWNRDIEQDDFYPLWLLYFMSGMRRGEGVALQWDDINFETGTISIRRASDSGLRKATKPTKTYRDRPVLMDPETMSVLKAHRSQRAKLGIQFVRSDAFVFGNLDGSVRNPGDVGERWSKTLAKARQVQPQLTHLTIKGMRHTHATQLLEAGVSGKVVQERLGHSNIATTMDIYSHVTQTLQLAAVQALSRYLKGA